MEERTFITSPPNRQKITRWLSQCSDGVIVQFRKPKRTVPQNSRMWAMLGDIANGRPDGIERTPEDWKSVFMKALGHEVRFIHGLDGNPFPVGFSTSKLNVAQMTVLMDLIQDYANEKNIVLNEVVA